MTPADGVAARAAPARRRSAARGTRVAERGSDLRSDVGADIGWSACDAPPDTRRSEPTASCRDRHRTVAPAPARRAPPDASRCDRASTVRFRRHAQAPAGSLARPCPSSRPAPGCATSSRPNRRAGGGSSACSPRSSSAAGYGQVIPPLLEDLGVFHRVGDATDVVTKEMYDFVDKGDRHVALRPEQTASVVPRVRAAPAADPVEGLVRRSELPLREAPARPLPPVRPGRHRGARRRRPVPRRRGDRARLGVLRRASACAR